MTIDKINIETPEKFIKTIAGRVVWHKSTLCGASGFHIAVDYNGDQSFDGSIYYYKEADSKCHKFKLKNFFRIFEILEG